MASSINIRPAQPTDVESAIRLLAGAGLPVDDVTDARLALVATCNQRLAGVIGLEQFASVGLLRSLVVDPDSRSDGLGQRLVRALEDLAIGRGIAELWLLTIDADPYFEKLGFLRRQRDAAPEAIVTTEEYSSLCPGDAVLMSKILAR